MAGGGFPAGEDDLAEAHEINITPFIDVMLVLLIVFMVAAPLSTTDVPVTLPSSAAPPPERTDDPVTLTLTTARELSLNGAPVPADGLSAALEGATQGRREVPVLIRADAGLAYGDVMGLLEQLRAAGYLKVALVGEEKLP